jgi:predicted TIM-barrel fold metal-dependent hydrolase
VSPTEAVVFPPALVDTHVHILSADRDRFPLGPTGLGRHWWSEPGRDAEALLSVMDEKGVDRALAAQAVGPYGYDNTYLLHAVSVHADRLAAVPAVDVEDRTQSDDDLAASIARLGESPGVVGVRLFGVAPGASWPHDEARARVALHAVRRAGLVAVLTVMPVQLEALTKLIQQNPDLQIALDHCAFPELVGGLVPAGAPLLAMKQTDNVGLKVSSHLLREAAAGGDPAGLVAQLAETFGSERLLWGSDYPQTDGDYDALLGDAAEAVRSLGAEARAGFFAGNAIRTFFAGRPGFSQTSERGS